jgi:hypothetical protein
LMVEWECVGSLLVDCISLDVDDRMGMCWVTTG